MYSRIPGTGSLSSLRTDWGSSTTREAGLSGLKADSSLEARGESELRMGSSSTSKVDLLKVNGWNAGSENEHFVRLKIAQTFCFVKGKEGKSPVRGRGEKALGN
jgi:hypothetical protein